jgi:hypothetical protein
MRRATDTMAVVIALAGFAVSYTTQANLAAGHGFPGWEAWLWPGIADAAALAMILRLHLGQVRPGWYTAEAWSVFGAASTIMVGANAIADRQDPLGGGMHAVVPVVAMLVAHVIVHGRPVDVARGRATATPTAATAEAPHPRQRRASGGDRDRRLARHLSRRPDATAAEVALALGVSRRTAQRLLAEARRPRVVAEES